MNLSNLLKSRNFKIIVVDLLMMWLLIINLSLIIFDWIFANEVIQDFFRQYAFSFYQYYYEYVHKEFLIIDLYFVAVFVLELSVRWIIAIKRRTYHRWFFYPFVHWYDTLGCIPVGSFRFLRILRVISIIIRLQKLQIIDLTRTYLFDRINKYFNILVEEVSDRVVVNVLEGVQEEIRRGNPLSEKVIEQVILPQKEALVAWLSLRIQQISTGAHIKYKGDIRQYVDKLIEDAVAENKEIKTVSHIPVFGSIMTANLEKIISDIVYNVIDGMIRDLSSPNNKAIIDDVTNLTLETVLREEEDIHINQIAKDMVVQSLDLIKEQVKIQQWKIKDTEEKEARIRNRMKSALEEGGEEEFNE